MDDADRYLNIVDVEATRGEDDAWNIAALVLDLSSRGQWPA